MNETTVRETITRPNGKTYRPRAVRAVLLDEDWGEEQGCLVLGTRDEEAARPLADREIRAFDSNLCAGDCTQGWWRLTIRQGDPFYEWNAERGAAGLRFKVVDTA